MDPSGTIYYDAIVFPSDGRPPSVVKLLTSPIPSPRGSYSDSVHRMPHPEIHMDYIAEGGPRAWDYQLIEALDGMSRTFASPYIIFYPVRSRDGMPFPINKTIRDIQGRGFREEVAWRGNIVVAKYRGDAFTSLVNASMADFPILRNYLLTHGAPH
ncbi:hypothetical protein D9613_005447 [Agrocybe pediades]|uniref:Uncharacterized protein n=1 Tax=Agrocybe pediades TaxID=84607 RepID=A0A8H4VS10_9AGAR|nr:hypothetical protein D9613_005447 [Agrocybe pediades]KAF9569445.1 hypothetical protein CPC08DRAFT_183727 [Agrocybe pediades]